MPLQPGKPFSAHKFQQLTPGMPTTREMMNSMVYSKIGLRNIRGKWLSRHPEPYGSLADITTAQQQTGG